MSNKELEEFLMEENSGEDTEEVKLDIDQIKANLPQYSNEKLCEMIVCDRYFGFEKKISTICMEELAKRRLAGNFFNFEAHIEKVTKELPVLDLSAAPDIRTVMNQAISKKIDGR
jgi:hypothetical protein